MHKQHYDLFLQKLEVEKQIAALEQTRLAIQQQITDKHLEQEYARFISCDWLTEEEQKLVNQAVQVRQEILATAYSERRKQLVNQFVTLQLELHKQDLEDDFLYAWKLAELKR